MTATQTTMMRALVLRGIGQIHPEFVNIPAVPAGWCLVRVAFCGVCGSDIPRIFTKGTYHFPTICGHEFSGTIESCGADVSGFAPGDQVAVFPLLWCGHCAACEKGQYVKCSDYDYLGSRRDGGFAEYVAAPARNLLRLPPGVSLEEAAMTEPASVALHALRRTQRSLVGEDVVIFGAGPIGLMVAQWARIMGARQVILFDVIKEKLTQAAELGFTLAFDSRRDDPIAHVQELTAGQGAAVCVDAAGVPPTLLAAMKCAARNGSVVLLGNPSADVTVPAPLLSQLMRQEVQLLGTWNSDYTLFDHHNDWRTVLTALAQRKLRLSPLVTHRVALDDALDVLTMMKQQSHFYSKVLIHP